MIDPEVQVLGSIMLEEQAYWRCADVLTDDDFANPAHRRMWSLLTEMAREGATIDVFTVAARDPTLERVAIELHSSQAFSTNVRAYAEVLAKRATERRVHTAGQRIANLRGDDILGEANRILAAASPRNMKAVRHAKDVLKDSARALMQRYESQEAMTGLETSLPMLDELTSGWQRSDLIVLGARPSVGKTALGLQCALHAVSMATPVPTLFFTAEMADRQLMDRAIAHLSNVSLKAIRSPKLIDSDGWDGITRATKALENVPLWLDDSSGLTVDMIAARARQLDTQHRLGLIVVDYLQHLQAPKAETVAAAMQIMTRALKGVAKQLNVPVLLLSQLNRDGDDRPTLKHLRDSGAIEQDADLVLLLHRPDAQKWGQIEWILAKQRNGECGNGILDADYARMRFREGDWQAPAAPVKRGDFRGSGRDRQAQS